MTKLKTMGEIRNYLKSVRTGKLINFRSPSNRDFKVDEGVLEGLAKSEVVDPWDRHTYVYAHLVNGVPEPQVIYQVEGDNVGAPFSWKKRWIEGANRAIISPQGIETYAGVIRGTANCSTNTDFTGDYIGIPYGGLLYKGKDNVIVSAMSASNPSWNPFRKDKKLIINAIDYDFKGQSVSNGIKSA